MRLFDDHSSQVDRFGVLLVTCFIAVVTLSLVDLRSSVADLGSEAGVILVSIFVGATLLFSLRSSGVARRYRRIADVLVAAGVLATSIVVIAESLGDRQVSLSASPSYVWVVLSAAAPFLVVRRLTKHQRATGRTLLGAVSAFLLIALAFNFFYLLLDAATTSEFFGSEEPTTSFMYFSLVTITTLGYGDLSAAEPFGRLLTTVEAVVGQVYLVTFVGMIVGLIVGQQQSRTAE